MNKDFFIEDLDTSEDEDFKLIYRKWKRSARIKRDDSPPAILAFSITSGRDKRGDPSPEPSPCGDMDSDQGDSDESVEEWMILDEEEEGDSNIQLNLSYSSVSSEDDSENEAVPDKKLTSPQDPWAVSKKDKSGEMSSICRYYMPGRSLFCPICKKNSHLAKNCPLQKKSPTCVLCGIQGHLQKECPSRPCSRCGLLSHGLRDCDRPPVWHQHCQRCGMTGHLCDICPDTWRQYHYTIKLEVPIKLQTLKAFKHKRPAYCFNCSKKGHYGYDCRSKRMVSGTFFNLPYVCHYGTTENALQISSRTQNKNTEFTNETQPLTEQHFFEPFEGNCKEDQLFQIRNKIKQKAHNHANFRKTWPERRRERQEVKRLRREAQARREGGVLGQCQLKPDDEILYSDPFGPSNSWQSTCPFKKTNKKVAGVRRNRKSRETEQWKKRGGKKHGFLYPQKKTDIGSENLLSSSSKQRVRHRRR